MSFSASLAHSEFVCADDIYLALLARCSDSSSWKLSTASPDSNSEFDPSRSACPPPTSVMHTGQAHHLPHSPLPISPHFSSSIPCFCPPSPVTPSPCDPHRQILSPSSPLLLPRPLVAQHRRFAPPITTATSHLQAGPRRRTIQWRNLLDALAPSACLLHAKSDC